MRNIFIVLCVCLNSCFLVVDDTSRSRGDDSYHNDSHYGGVAMWFADAWATCYYDHYSGYSDWYFFAVVDSSDGYDAVYTVEVVINDLSYIEPDYILSLYWGGYGEWDAAFTSWYYDCNYAYDLRFIAYDYSGNSMDTWVMW